MGMILNYWFFTEAFTTIISHDTHIYGYDYGYNTLIVFIASTIMGMEKYNKFLNYGYAINSIFFLKGPFIAKNGQKKTV